MRKRTACCILTLLLLFAFAVEAASPLVNQLRDNPSPYLELHADDPVKWQVWSPEVLQRARAENKLIFLSSGYFSCHWCHVMRHESYNNSAIAAILNSQYIPVKVDRELAPGLDAYLIDFVQRTRGSAGWPLNTFITPEGYPLFGLTYAPPEKFQGLLQRMTQLWETKQQTLVSSAREAGEALVGKPLATHKLTAEEQKRLATNLAVMVLAMGDNLEGGIGRQNRFPMPVLWSTLIGFEAKHPDRKLRDLILLTLDQIAARGMRDHLAGGFFRYTVDPSWSRPHFEKMLYTQALLVPLYLEAAKAYGREDYREVARDTLDFTLKVFAGEGGGFIASLSAVDPQDHEGGGYLWSEAQLTRVLNPDELVFARKRWNLQGDFVTDNEYLPMRGESLEPLAKAEGKTIDEMIALEELVRNKLLQARAPRNHPRDGKQLAAWNGLMLTALTRSAKEFGETRYREAAKALYHYLSTRLWDGKSLSRMRWNGKPGGEASIEDYAYVAQGIYRWGEFAGDKEAVTLAKRLVNESWQRFYTEMGWRSNDRALLPAMPAAVALPDNPLPAPVPILVQLTTQLGDASQREQALAALQNSYPEIEENPLWYASHVVGLLNWVQFAQGY